MDMEHESTLKASVAEKWWKIEQLEALVAELKTENAELAAENSQIAKLQETVELIQ